MDALNIDSLFPVPKQGKGRDVAGGMRSGWWERTDLKDGGRAPQLPHPGLIVF